MKKTIVMIAFVIGVSITEMATIPKRITAPDMQCMEVIAEAKTICKPVTGTTRVKPLKVEEQEKLGKFKLTAYCGCRKCNGKWYGYPTKSGTDYKQGRTIAVDPKIIPLGSYVYINGHKYIAEDTGSAIKGKRIDIFIASHQKANEFGVQYANVTIKYKKD